MSKIAIISIIAESVRKGIGEKPIFLENGMMVARDKG
jgi:hypothetical protein